MQLRMEGRKLQDFALYSQSVDGDRASGASTSSNMQSKKLLPQTKK